MGTISRNNKAAGGTSFDTGKGTIVAAEVDADFDTAFGEINGQLEDANISASAAIDPEKIDDYSSTAAESRSQLDPGNSGTPTQADGLEQELRQIRYAVRRMAVGTDAVRNTSDAAGWQDIPTVGPNLIKNPQFVRTLASGTTAPDDWTKVGTPTSLETIAVGVAAEGVGNALRIVSAGSAADGIQQTLAGLKASTKYLIGARVKADVGSVDLITTGADAAVTTYDDLLISTSGSSYETLSGIIITDSTPTNIVVQLLADSDATADDFDIRSVWCYECADNPLPQTSWWGDYQSSQDDGTTITATPTAVSGISAVSVTAPGPGYVIRVRCKAQATATASRDFVVSIEEDSTEKVRSTLGMANGDKGALAAEYWNESPTPGTAYSMQMTVWSSSATGLATDAPGPVDSHWLSVELIKR